jgi:hypothetical protein
MPTLLITPFAGVEFICERSDHSSIQRELHCARLCLSSCPCAGLALGLLAFGPVGGLGFGQVGLRERKVNCRQLLNDFQQCPFRNFVFLNACSIPGLTYAQSA